MTKTLGIALFLALSTSGVAFAHSHSEFEASSPPAASGMTHHTPKTISHGNHKADKEPSHASKRHEPGAKGHNNGAARSKS